MVVMYTGCLLHLTVSVHYLGTLFRGMLLAAPDLHGPHGPHLDLRHLLHATTTTGSSCPFPVPPLVLGSAPLCLAQAWGVSRAFLTWVMCWVRDARLCAWHQAAHPGLHEAGAQMYPIQHCGSSL